jgi:tetratricopeptide (TPR) repeat protein
MDQFEKDSILQLRPDRATEVMAFVEYEQGVESARRADQLNVENTDQLWESASESLNKAVELDPSFVAPRIVLACIHLYYKNEHDKAKQLLDEAIRREPANAEAHYYLADVHYDDGNEEEAMREVNLAINLDPNLAPAYRMRSRLYEARNELSEAAHDFIDSVSLTGNLDADHVYPWTHRSVLFRSKESGLTLQYSSVWYPFESMAKGSELRLIRHDHSREIAFSLIYLGEVFHPGMKREDMVVDLFEGMCEAFVGNAEIVRIGAGDLILGRQWVHWIDYEIESPPLLATRSRIFMLEHAGKVWSIQFSTRDEVLFRQYLPSAEEVIRSISFH